MVSCALLLPFKNCIHRRFSLQKNVGRRIVDPRGAAVCGPSKDLGHPHLCQLLLEVGKGACLLVVERSKG